MAIISHKHQFIFLKTRKTASSSLEIAIGNVCGPEDCLCPTGDGKEFGIVEQNNQKRLRELTLHDFAQFSNRLFKDIRKTGKPKLNRSFKKLTGHIKSAHANAREMRKICGEEIWNNYYKFCFERNPFDRLVSLYHWRTKNMKSQPSFKEFALSVAAKHQSKGAGIGNADFWTNRPYYEIDGKLVVDRVCRFENLSQELEEFYKRINVPWNAELPHMKGNYRPQKNYRDYYDTELIDIFKKIFAYEIENLGYSF